MTHYDGLDKDLDRSLEEMYASLTNGEFSKKKAYKAGVRFALSFLMLYLQAGKKSIEYKLAKYMFESSDSLNIFLQNVAELSDYKAVIPQELVRESGLRYGEPGKYYSLGIRDGVEIGFDKLNKKRSLQKKFDWISTQVEILNK